VELYCHSPICFYGIQRANFTLSARPVAVKLFLGFILIILSDNMSSCLLALKVMLGVVSVACSPLFN
jgi:hypothetical protein